MNIKRLSGFTVSILTMELLGLLSFFLSSNIESYYKTLKLPPLAPPPWLFSLIWPILFLLLGISFYLIYESKSYYKKEALKYYAIQLLINFIWPILFFRFKLNILAIFSIIILIVLVDLTIIKFRSINKIASRLLIPYFIWILFASYLTIAISIMNLSTNI